MLKEQILALATLVSIAILPASNAGWPVSGAVAPPASPSQGGLVSPAVEASQVRVLTQHILDLNPSQNNNYTNQVFGDNMLLVLHYPKGDVTESANINWAKVREPFSFSLVLKPGEVFAFHDNVLTEFADPVATMNSHFLVEEGYKSIGGLGGNGVCYLASLINWVARGSGLEVVSLVDHNFAPVPGVPKEYGVSIRSQSKTQNLYIKNNFDRPVIFEFKTDSERIDLRILLAS